LKGRFKRLIRYCLNIKPLAWLIILGDGIHNFTDGLAIGGAISQSLSLGLSTAIAVIFHEIPHEFGKAYQLEYSGRVCNIVTHKNAKKKYKCEWKAAAMLEEKSA